jgi:DNA repair exonuclease SbcCD ATPase subunit
MKVTRLTVQHVKGVRFIDVHADPHCNEIAGPNGAGKSSVLDAIVWAFSGKRSIDSKPLRDGAEKGEILVETETLLVRRRFSENGDTKLQVEAKDGRRLGQRELDGLFGRFSFDPLAFSRMDTAEQLTTLQQLAGEEFCSKLAAVDAQIAKAVEERLLCNRELARVGQIPEVPPAEGVDASALAAQLQELDAFNEEQDRRERAIERQALTCTDLAAQADRLAKQLHEIQRQLSEASVAHDKAVTDLGALPQPEPLKDKAPTLRAISEAGAQNQRAAAHRAYLDRVQGKAERAQESNAAEARLLKLREEREALRRSAALPVPGVEFGESGLRVAGIPFDQLASSERIRISARIGMSMNPALRVMFIKDGSLLDLTSFGEVRTLAEEQDYQLWVETVGNGHGDAIILEAGEVASVPLSAAENF